MKPIEVTQANFEEVADRGGIVVLDFWAPWCEPCQAFMPVFEKAAERHPDIVFGKVNTEDDPALAAAFHIRAIPTLMILRDGVLLFVQPGALPEAPLEDLIAQARALDVEEVRAQFEAAAREPSERETSAGAQPPGTSSR